MGSPNGSSLTDASTYQAIIIALVVGTILIIATSSFLIRRRRRQMFLQQIMNTQRRIDADGRRGGVRWMELADGRVMQVRTAAGEGVVVQPQIWDVGLGNKGVEMYADEDGVEWNEKEDQEGEGEGGEGEGGREVDVVDTFDAEWRPLSTTLPDHAQTTATPPTFTSSDPQFPARNIELSVLIAMPSPDQIVKSASSSSTSVSYVKPIHLDDYPILHTLSDKEYLPSLEIGSIGARVSTGQTDLNSWKDVTRDIDERYKRHRELANRRR